MISVASNLMDVAKRLDKYSRQIPFATSLGMNRTAIKVQRFLVDKQLPSKLKLRNQWWRPGTKYGVNVNFSRKDNLVADVFSKAPWLRLVEHGGQKLPLKRHSAKGNTIGAFNIVPIIGGARQSEMQRIDSRNFPGRGNQKVFFAKKLKGVFMLGTFRTNKHGRRRVVGDKNKFDANWGDEVIRPKLTLLWSFTQKSIRVKPILKFQESGQRVWNENIGEEMEKALDHAFKTAF